MMENLNISLAIMLLLALGIVIYPFRRLLKWGLSLVGLIIPLVILGYLQWGGKEGLQQFTQEKDKEKQAQAMLKSIQNPNDLIAQLKTKIQQAPENPKGWYLLGRIYSAQGNWQAAQNAFNKAFKLNPSDEQIAVNYAQSIWQANGAFNTAARKIFQTVLQKNPKQPDALAMLAMDAYISHNYSKAIDLWQRLLPLAPTNSKDAIAIRKAIAKAQDQLRAGKKS